MSPSITLQFILHRTTFIYKLQITRRIDNLVLKIRWVPLQVLPSVEHSVPHRPGQRPHQL